MLRKVPVYALPLTLFAGMGLTYSVMQLTGALQAVVPSKIPVISAGNCDYKFERLSGYKFIKPLILAEENCESERYNPLKNEISKVIAGYTGKGTIQTAAVYFKNLKNGEWICLNCGEQFDPGSLIKVPVLIAYLRMEENNPGTLNKQLNYPKPFAQKRSAVFLSKEIESTHSYSIKELLNYMILYSDNNATSLLLNHIDGPTFGKVFTDLGLRPIDSAALTYPLTAREYSVFMEAIYNVSYLTIPHSEYAASLLSQSDFSEGLAKGIPAGIKIAHKFGEGGDAQGLQLHESGIVYLEGNPYLLTVMTKGPELNKLPQVISSISQLVCTDMSAAN